MQSKFFVDPNLPLRFFNTPNDERVINEFNEWFEVPFGITNSDNSMTVYCLDGAVWNSPTNYGIVKNITEAKELFEAKLSQRRKIVAVKAKYFDEPV